METVLNTGKVNTNLLNLRSSPDGSVIKVLPQFTKVNVLKVEGGWLRVRVEDDVGYVSSRYVQILPPSTPVKRPFGIVSANRLNLREQPNGRVLDVLRKDTSVKIVEEQGDWFKVDVNNITGYVSASYIIQTPANTPPPRENTSDIEDFHFEDKDAIAPDGSTFAKKFRKGVFSSGDTSIAHFVDNNSNLFDQSLSSSLQVMKAVSENEGKYEAINTWDNSFLSFGIFQWTCGAQSEAGELPALLNKIEINRPDIFEKYFGRYGLKTTGVRTRTGVASRGYFELRGVLLGDKNKKNSLRSLPWAYRFKLAGQDDVIREIQTQHAIERISLFYHQDNRKVNNFYVSDYITSEYGVALLLDQHVNRPGHVPRILANAVNALKNELDIDQPQNWQDADENRLIEKYLALREETSMTHPAQRAKTVQKYVRNGVISDKRGSYQAI